MKDHDLLEAVGGINEKFINNASTIKAKKSKKGYFKWIAAVACLCVIVGGIAYMNNIGINTDNTDAGNGVDGTVIPGGDTSDEDIDPVMGSIAVFPSTESMENVADATLTEIPKEKLLSKNFEEALELNSETVPEHLIRYLPDKLPDGYELESAILYETTMNSGAKYYMVRVTYSTPSSTQDVEDVLEGFTVFVMNYRPNVEKDIYTVDDLPETALDGSTFHISIDDVYVGFSDVVDLTWEELQIVLKSLKKEVEVEEAGEAEIIVNDNSGDAPVDENTYSEARDYSEEILDLQNRISAAMGPGHELYFVTVAEILENPDRLHVIVNTTDEELINTLKSYNTDGVNMEIEYSAGTAIEE